MAEIGTWWRARLTFAILLHASIAAGITALVVARLRRVHEYAVVGMSLDVLLQVLRSLESLAAEVAFVRLERDMYANVRCYVVTLHCGCPTCAPLACEVEIVGALATDMAFAYMIL